MDPARLIPLPDPIPVSWPFLQMPLTLTTFLHLVAMNVVIGGAIFSLAIRLRRQTSDLPDPDDPAVILPAAMAAAINLGVPPLLFLQTLYGQLLYTSSVLTAFFWLSIPFLLILSYSAIYLFHFRRDSRDYTASIFLAAATSLLLLVSLLFTNSVMVMQSPETWDRYFTSMPGLQANLDDPAAVPRYLHFMLSALAAGGLAAAWVGRGRTKRRGLAADAGRITARGCRIYCLATIINFAIGFWFLGKVLPAVNAAGGLTALVFGVALFGSIACAALSLVRAQAGQVPAATGWALATVFLMTIDRDCARLAALNPLWSPTNIPTLSSYTPMLVFILFAGGVFLLIRWMLGKAIDTMEVRP